MIWTKVFGRTSIVVGWWYGLVWTGWSIDHLFKASIPPSSRYSIHTFLYNHPVGKYLVWQGIKPIPSTKQQRGPLSFLLYLSLLLVLCNPKNSFKVLVLWEGPCGVGAAAGQPAWPGSQYSSSAHPPAHQRGNVSKQIYNNLINWLRRVVLRIWIRAFFGRTRKKELEPNQTMYFQTRISSRSTINIFKENKWNFHINFVCLTFLLFVKFPLNSFHFRKRTKNSKIVLWGT